MEQLGTNGVAASPPDDWGRTQISWGHEATICNELGGLTEEGVTDGFLGLTGDVAGEHRPHGWTDRLTALHEVEGEEETAFVAGVGSDGNEHDGTDDVDDDVPDHTPDCVSSLGAEPPGQRSDVGWWGCMGETHPMRM